MKPFFYVLSKNYPSKHDVTKEALFKEIGWDDLINNGNYADTCAIRVSVALIKSGIFIAGRMAIKKGPHKGKLIEPGQGNLSHLLARASQFGEPEKYKGGAAGEQGIGTRQGIVSFWRLHPEYGDRQGHIDIVSPALGGVLRCGGACYWGSGEVWFWPLR